MSQRLRVFQTAALASLMAGAAAGHAATIYVSKTGNDSNDGQSWATARLTIQSGITLTASGDQVWVAAGTYVERIQMRDGVAVYGGFSGSETDLSQRNWTTNVTIIDANHTGPVVVPGFASTAATRIDGFTLRNGQGTGSPSLGGGVYCHGAAPTIANNIITGNSASQGGGIYCESLATPLITNNVISGNTAGGIYCASPASPTITNNVISGNSAGTGSGGGIYRIGSTGAPVISNNTVSGNIAANGGGIYCEATSGQITNNRVVGNNASMDGGGIFLYNNSCTVANNVVAGNNANIGGGIYNYSSSPIAANNTIVGNAAGRAGGIYIQGLSPKYYNNIVAFNTSGIDGVGTATLSNNCVYNLMGANYVTITPGAGDISVDPQLLARSYGEFHLKPGSPCIDAGLDTVVQPSWSDMDSQPRTQGAHVDIGADEFNGATPAYTTRVVRVSTTGNDSNDGSSWALAKRTVQAGIDSVTGPVGGDVWVAGGTYNERISPKLYSRVYGGFAGVETSREARNWVSNVSTLDGGAGGAVVSISYLGLDAAAIDGFTIRNGKAEWGGGMNCSFASPTIANNTFTANVGLASGAGIYCVNNGFAMITNNAFVNNTGGAIQCQGSSPFIINNTIADNTTHFGGAAISLYASPAVISNNVVAFNGYGIYNATSTNPPTLRNNCVYSPGGTNYSGSVAAGVGDISMDPLFVNRPAGDYHLSSASPCIDAGYDAALISPPLTDLARHARILDDPATPDCRWSAGNCGAAPVLDVGAYEYVPSLPADFNHDGFVDAADLSIFTACATRALVPYDPAHLPEGCTLDPDATGHIAADFNLDGSVDQNDFGVFQRCYSGLVHPANPNCSQ